MTVINGNAFLSDERKKYDGYYTWFKKKTNYLSPRNLLVYNFHNFVYPE